MSSSISLFCQAGRLQQIFINRVFNRDSLDNEEAVWDFFFHKDSFGVVVFPVQTEVLSSWIPELFLCLGFDLTMWQRMVSAVPLRSWRCMVFRVAAHGFRRASALVFFVLLEQQCVGVSWPLVLKRQRIVFFGGQRIVCQPSRD